MNVSEMQLVWGNMFIHRFQALANSINVQGGIVLKVNSLYMQGMYYLNHQV